jgi:alkylation response protein AidB-like acyl-CoA dehydrogenase
MTFELSPEHEAVRERARGFAEERLASVAAAIDDSASIPADVLRELQAVVAGSAADATALVVSVEQLAIASPAAAAAVALDQSARPAADLAGLRGFRAADAADPRGRLVFAAVAAGIGRAAIREALRVLRATGRGGEEPEKPHWVVADAATEVEAARMLTLQAAQAVAEGGDASGAVAMAKLAATRAAQQAVDAALRVTGPDGFARGTLVERLTRDVRAVSLLMGTEEELRAAVAQAVLQG